MSNTKHTPTPWFPGRTFGRGIGTVDAIDPADGLFFAVCEVFGVNKMDEACEISEANAAFIVRACNAHEQLVAALHEIVKEHYAEGPDATKAIVAARDLLKSIEA